MKHVIDLNEETVIELRLPAVEGAGDEPPPTLLLRLVPLEPDMDTDADTAGFAAGAGITPAWRPIVPPPTSHSKLIVVCDPRPGPPIELPGQDVQAFMMNEKPENTYPNEKGPASPSSGAPFGLVFEWLDNPAGTFGKFFFS